MCGCKSRFQCVENGMISIYIKIKCIGKLACDWIGTILYGDNFSHETIKKIKTICQSDSMADKGDKNGWK